MTLWSGSLYTSRLSVPTFRKHYTAQYDFRENRSTDSPLESIDQWVFMINKRSKSSTKREKAGVRWEDAEEERKLKGKSGRLKKIG